MWWSWIYIIKWYHWHSLLSVLIVDDEDMRRNVQYLVLGSIKVCSLLAYLSSSLTLFEFEFKWSPLHFPFKRALTNTHTSTLLYSCSFNYLHSLYSIDFLLILLFDFVILLSLSLTHKHNHRIVIRFNSLFLDFHRPPNTLVKYSKSNYSHMYICKHTHTHTDRTR